MAKTLIIKDVDFTSHALDVVAFGTVPCTGIALNKSIAEILSIGGTETLIATLTPANTTDTLTWASSDTDVATVANGVVTTVGVGTTTITATCGNQSATCVITSRAFMNTSDVLLVPNKYFAGNDAESGGSGLGYLDSNGRSGTYTSSAGTLTLYDRTDYPYMLPKGTAKVRVTLPADSLISEMRECGWFNSETHATGYNSTVELIRRVNPFTKSGLVFEANVPSVEGFPEIDCFVLSLRMPSGNTMTEEAMSAVTIEFLPAE